MDEQKTYSLIDLLKIIKIRFKNVLIITLFTVVIIFMYFFVITQKNYSTDSIIALSNNEKINTQFGEVPSLLNKAQDIVPLFYDQKIFESTLAQYDGSLDDNIKIKEVLNHEITTEDLKTINFSMVLEHEKVDEILNSYLKNIESKINALFFDFAIGYLKSSKHLELEKFIKHKKNLLNTIDALEGIIDSVSMTVDVPKQRANLLMNAADFFNPNYLAIEHNILERKKDLIKVEQDIEDVEKQIEVVLKLEDDYIFKSNYSELKPEMNYFGQLYTIIKPADEIFLGNQNPLKKSLIFSILSFFAVLFFVIMFHLFKEI